MVTVLAHALVNGGNKSKENYINTQANNPHASRAYSQLDKYMTPVMKRESNSKSSMIVH